MARVLNDIRTDLRSAMLADRDEAIPRLLKTAGLSAETRQKISVDAAELVRAVRQSSRPRMIETLLAEYGLSTDEGVALMCLAEALLRVPDGRTIDELIRDKVTRHDWAAHSRSSSPVYINATAWALMLTGHILDEGNPGIAATLRGLVRRLGEPSIRTAVSAAMRSMGEQFILGQSIDAALTRAAAMTANGYRYSFDMLGEGARTEDDAERHHQSYFAAIRALGKDAGNLPNVELRGRHSISVKLSALHPRYEATHRELVVPEIASRLLELCQAARNAGIGLSIDAEESDRLDLSLDVMESVLRDPSIAGWDGFGAVVQAYGPRAPFVLEWLHALAGESGAQISVRLVKGAYWDTEIKRAQVLGLDGFPVFTSKPETDLSYIACARMLLDMTDRIYPQFATHNAHTMSAVLAMADDDIPFEFQRLHGMGEALHEEVRRKSGIPCRIYAPVGRHADLLAYLVRRLLENGANSSFVHQIIDETVLPEAIAADPLLRIEANDTPHAAIRHPSQIYSPERRNSAGFDFTDPVVLDWIETARAQFAVPNQWAAVPAWSMESGETHSVYNPARHDDIVGSVTDADPNQIGAAVSFAADAQSRWALRPVDDRAEQLRKAADLYEAHAGEFLALCCREAGKTLNDGVAELREAVDFLRYYASQATIAEAGTQARGVIACTSPWNFPLAIFTGQVAAALATGNAVLAKPAEQTPLIAARAVSLLHEAGIPEDLLQLVPGDGRIGAALVADPRIAGVCFTGSVEVARHIEAQLAQTAQPDAMLIAETGGINAMIVDSTALTEQVVRDVITSAFQSAGQRCSALRMLYIQEDAYDRTMTMLKGALEALVVGDPWRVSTDVGPLINGESQDDISGWCKVMGAKGHSSVKRNAPSGGSFLGPHIFEVAGIGDLQREVFGPVLHVARFRADQLDAVVAAINAKGYGLTFGLHTRIDGRVQQVVDQIEAGNIYVNRNQIGAIVGSQPFGGVKLSGTGPKAGGPFYLRRFRKAPTPPAPGTSTAGSPYARPGAFPDAGGWAQRDDRIATLRRLLRGRAANALSAAAALDMGPVDLPGPTGEANSLSLAPRGKILCAGPGPDSLLAQTVQALASGNCVIAVDEYARAALAPLLDAGLPLVVQDGRIDPDWLVETKLDGLAVLASAHDLRILRRALAERKGPLVPLITDPVLPHAYCIERTLCVDTTAAGGNASLFASIE